MGRVWRNYSLSLVLALIHRGSHESKDTDEKVQAQLDRIEQRLASLSGPAQGGEAARPGGRRDNGSGAAAGRHQAGPVA